MSSKYRVKVERDQRVWFVDVEGVGATQARHLRELDDMTLDLIHLVTGDETVTADDIDYHLVLPVNARRHVERAEKLRKRIDEERRQANVELATAALELSREYHLPMRDIGRLLGVSHQRVHQLLHDDELQPSA